MAIDTPGRADREYVGYIGSDREYGQLTSNYGGKTVDVYGREHAPTA